MKVLVVDDSKLHLMMVEGQIKASNLIDEIVLCSGGSNITEIITVQNIDIVFLDIIMPGKSGLEILKEIRENPQLDDVQVIMLTSSTYEGHFKESFNNGADDFLKKPVDPIELQARLKAAIKTRKSLLLVKEMNKSLTAKNRELTSLNKRLKETQFGIIQQEKLASIGELAAGVAHEINNPIGFVGSNIEVMQKFMRKISELLVTYRRSMEELQQTQCTECSGTIIAITDNVKAAEAQCKIDFVMSEAEPLLRDSLDGINRVAKIVQTLRSFAHTGMEGESEPANVVAIIEEALLILKNEYKYTIEIEKSYDQFAEIICNRGQIEQVIINILMNAIQAIKSQKREEKGRIWIGTRREGQELQILISDDGPGIPKKVLGRIFDPFFTTKDVGEGTGLGLSISYDIIVNKHHGRILAQNNADAGASFTIILPIEKMEQGELNA